MKGKESLGGVLGGLRGVLGGAGTALEAYKRRPGGSQGRLGAVLGPLEAVSDAKKLLKCAPKGSPIELQRRLELKIAKP